MNPAPFLAAPSEPSPGIVDPHDASSVEHWREVFGVTAEQLAEAVRAVGGDPAAVREHLLHQGGSAGAG